MAGLGRRSHYRKHVADSVLNDYPEPDATLGERIAKVVGTRGSNQFEIILASSSTSSECPLAPKLAILPTKFRKLVWVKRNDFVIVRCGEDMAEAGDEINRGRQEHENNNVTGYTSRDTNRTNNPEEIVTGGIRYEISRILYKSQVKHLKKKGLWPDDDPNFRTESISAGGGDEQGEGSLPAAPRSVPPNNCCEGSLSEASDGFDSATDVGRIENEDCGGDDEDHSNRNDGIIYDREELFVNTNKISALKVQDDSESDSDSSEGSY